MRWRRCFWPPEVSAAEPRRSLFAKTAALYRALVFTAITALLVSGGYNLATHPVNNPTLLRPAQPEASAGGARFRGGDRVGRDEEPGNIAAGCLPGAAIGLADYRNFGVSGAEIFSR